jgi:hypothetical protein
MAQIGGRANEATELLEHSIASFEAEGDTHPAARVSARLAQVMWDRGRMVEAVERMERSFQILSKEGKFLAEYDGFGRISGLAVDRNDVIYTADSESTEKVHPGWQRGIRIGSLKDGKVTTLIPPHMVPNSTDGAMGEGIAIDAAGNIYTAEAQLRGVTKYVRK